MPVHSPHPDYLAMLSTWMQWRDAYAGARAVKARGTLYLAQPMGMKRAKQYQAYVSRAVFFGATERAVHGLAGAVGRRPPQVLAPGALTSALSDITLTGVPLTTFAEQVLRETLLMGRAGVLVDFPRVEGMPRQPGQQATVIPTAPARPYWVPYQAEEILNWRTLQRQGEAVLSLVVLKESLHEPAGAYPDDTFFAPTTVTQYRVLRLNDQGLYEVSVWRELPMAGRRTGGMSPGVVLQDTWVPTRHGEPLTTIPFVFLAPFSLEPAIETSLLDGLIEVNYQYYRHSADYEHGLHLTALPTPYVTGHLAEGTELLIGSQAAWIIDDAQATVGMLEFHGAGLSAFEHALEADIKAMATLGSRLMEGPALVAETATSVLARTQGSESPIQSLVATVSQGLTKALQWAAWWAGSTENPRDPGVLVQLNTDLLAVQMTPQMLQQLVSSWLSGAIAFETLYEQLRKGEMTRPGIDAAAEQTLIDIEVATRSNGVAGGVGGGL